MTKRGRPTGKSTPDPVDIHVGKRIKLRRTIMSVSQDQLAGDIGVTFQQVQKYESGYNRVSASRLYDIAAVLTCPIQFFYDDMPDTARVAPESRRPDDLDDDPGDPMRRTETLELVKAYWRIPNDELRDSLRSMIGRMTAR